MCYRRTVEPCCTICAGPTRPLQGPAGPARRCAACGLLESPRAVYDAALDLRPEVVAARRSLHARLLDLLPRPPGALLDVGCGAGGFLELARDAGWRAVGIDRDPRAAAAGRSRGLDVRQAPVESIPGKLGPFDAVTLWNSLDVTDDPVRTLRAVFAALKPGGMVMVRVPNATFKAALWRASRAAGADSVSGLSTLHRHGFSRAALLIALRNSGFEDCRVRLSPCAPHEPYTAGLDAVWKRLSALSRLLPMTSWLACGRRPSARAPACHVLHLITRLDPGGSTDTALALAGGPAAPRLAAGGREVPALGREIRPWRDLRAFFGILGLLLRERPRILHTHTSKAGLLGRWAAWVLNRTVLSGRPIKLVHTAHGHVLYGYFGAIPSRIFGLLESISARITDRLIAVSAGELEESLAAGIGTRTQWTVIPPGRPRRELPARGAGRSRARLGAPAGAPVIGTLSRLEPVKGVEQLIRAAVIVLREEPRAQFIVAGDGSQRRRLEALTHVLGVAHAVHFVGWRPASQILPELHIYIQPSLNEAFGLALLQAMAAGKPVVGTAVCGIPDLIEHGVTGLLAAPGDPRGLAEALLRLLRDRGLRRRLAAEAARRVARPEPDGDPLDGDDAVLRRRHERLYEPLLFDSMTA